MGVRLRVSAICIVAAMAAAASDGWAQAGSSPLRSGLYGQLTLGVDGASVTGVFADTRVGNGTEDAPQFSCIFALRGTLAKGETAVTTWFPGETASIPGMLTMAGDTAKLQLQEQPGGCDMTGDEFVKTAYAEPSVKDGAWTSVRMVSASRAGFHAAPVDSGAGRAYAVKGDAVVIYRHLGAWLDAEYLNGRRPVRGWLRASDLFPDHP